MTLEDGSEGMPDAELTGESADSTPAVETEVVVPQGFIATFAETFYAVLLHPVPAFRLLSQPVDVAPSKSNFFAAFILVLLSLTVFQFAQTGWSAHAGTVLNVVSTDALLWISLAGLIQYLSHWRTERVDFSRALFVTGWAFLPLLFSGPAALLALSVHGTQLVWHLTILTFLIFEAIACEALLKLGRVKMVALMIALPPLFAFVYLFWIFIGSAMVLSSLQTLLANRAS